MLEEMREFQEKVESIALEYGYEPQSRQLIEEMGELIQAVNKEWRIQRKYWDINTEAELNNARDEILEEIADVQIMLWQVAFLIQHDSRSEKSPEEVLSTIIRDKLNRQIARINKRHNQPERMTAKEKEFAEAVKPIHEWLCKYGDPYTSVTVEQNGAEAKEGIMAKPLPIPD